MKTRFAQTLDPPTIKLLAELLAADDVNSESYSCKSKRRRLLKLKHDHHYPHKTLIVRLLQYVIVQSK